MVAESVAPFSPVIRIPLPILSSMVQLEIVALCSASTLTIHRIPSVESETTQCCILKVLTPSSHTASILPQSPAEDIRASDLNLISLPASPTATSDPWTYREVLPSPLPVSSSPAGNITSVPGSMVSVTPGGIVTSPVRITVPDHVSSPVNGPEVVAPNAMNEENRIKSADR